MIEVRCQDWGDCINRCIDEIRLDGLHRGISASRIRRIYDELDLCSSDSYILMRDEMDRGLHCNIGGPECSRVVMGIYTGSTVSTVPAA